MPGLHLAVQAHGSDDAILEATIREHPRRGKPVAISRESARHDDIGAERLVEPSHQFRAVHVEALGEDEHGPEVFCCELAANAESGGEELPRVWDGDARTAK